MQKAPVRVTKLTQAPDGHWTANVSRNGSTTTVHNQHGAWMAQVEPGLSRFASPDVAVELQDRLRKAGGKVAKR